MSDPDTQQDNRVIDLAIRMLFIGVFAYASLSLVTPVIGVMLWAVILAVALYPAYAALRDGLRGRGHIAALVLVVVGLGIVLGPVAALALGVFDAATTLAQAIRSGALDLPDLPARLATLPVIGPQAEMLWQEAQGNLAMIAQQAGPVILAVLRAALGEVAGLGLGLIGLIASVVIMGLLFAPGPRLVAGAARAADRIFAPRGSDYVHLAGATVRNVSRGVIGVAILQSLLAGIVMALFGVPGAGPLALAALLLAIVQIGPGPVLVPVLIWGWLTMSPLTALLFTAVMIPVMIVDNILKPILMARGLQTPMLVIFVGVIGGMIAYGLVGVFVGPVILSVFYELTREWIEAGTEPAQTGKVPGTAPETDAAPPTQ